MKMYILTDTFNQRTLSRHKTVKAALEAERKHAAAIRKANGKSCYVTYRITASDGSDISEQVWEVRLAS